MARVKRSKNTLIVGCALVAVLALGAIVYAANRPHTPVTPATTAQETFLPKADDGQVTQSSSPAASASPIPASTAAQTSTNGKTIITSPTQGSTVTSGTRVSGTATTASSQLHYRLKGAKSGQLALGAIDFAGSASVAAPFSLELAFTNQVSGGADQGVLEIFTLGSDGSEQSIANVTVNIQG